MPYKDQERQKEAQRSSYQVNKKRYRWRQTERRKIARDFIWNIKEQSSCKKCDENNPIVLEFHHRDPSKKETTATKMVANKYSPKRISIELEKCDCVCANCHRIIHHEIGYEKTKRIYRIRDI